MTAADLVRRAREDAGLSRRTLAAKAGVPTSTISRIEEGASDPTLTMLTRVVSATGHQLRISVDAAPTGPSIAALADAVSCSPRGRKVAWHRLRGFLDTIAAHPEHTAAAIGAPPRRTGDRSFDALLAAIAEKVADDAGIPRPRWTRSVPPSPAPWESPGTPAMVRRARSRAPGQLKDRNIWLAEQDLWRDAG